MLQKKDILYLALVLIALNFILFFPWTQYLEYTSLERYKSLSELRLRKIQDQNRVYQWGMIQHRSKNVSNQETYQTILSRIKAATGIQIQIQSYHNYKQLESAFLNDQIQMANLSSFAYIRVSQKLPGKITGLVSEMYRGNRYYIGYFFSRHDSPYRSLQDLKNRRFVFVSKQSASGHLFPMSYLLSKGIHPETFFASVQYSSSHQNSIHMVKNKLADAGVTFDAVLNDLGQERLKYRILAKTDRIPSGVVCAGSNLDKAHQILIRNLLLSLNKSSDPDMILFRSQTEVTGWSRINPSDFLMIQKSLANKHI